MAVRAVAAPPAARLRRPIVWGLLGYVALVLGAGRVARPVNQVPPTDWLGLLSPFDSRVGRGLAGVAVVSGLLAAAYGFLLLVRAVAAGAVTSRGVVATAAVWALPLVLGPPLLSLDVHSYVAQGEMSRVGLDPYRVGPEFIRGPFYDPVDPRWRAAHAPYGPLALLLSRLAVLLGAGSPTGAVLVLRAVAVLAVVGAAAGAVRLSQDPVLTLVLAGAGPLVLITLVSAAHHEALVSALVVGALLAQRRGRPALAVALAAAALADKLPGAVALGALGALHLLSATSARDRLRVLARDGGAVLAVWVPLALLVPNPLGWVRALSTPGLGHTAYAPVSVVAWVTSVPEDLVRAVAEVVSVVVVGGLLVSVRRRPLEATVGWGLLVVALLGPVLYPWYVAPAAIVLATLPGARARQVSLICVGYGVVLGLPVLEAALRWLGGSTGLPAHEVVARGLLPRPQQPV